MRKVNIFGKTSAPSYEFVFDLKWECKSTLSRVIGLAIDFILEHHSDEFREFVKRETEHDRVKYYTNKPDNERECDFENESSE